jgi:hypothetical protein
MHEDPDYHGRLIDGGDDLVKSPSQQLKAFGPDCVETHWRLLKADMVKYARTIKTAEIKL